MKNVFRFIGFVFFFSLICSSQSHAEDSASYQFTVDTGVVSGLTHGPNAIQFMRKKMPVVIKTQVPVTAATVSSITTQGMLFGRYLSPKGTVDLELKVLFDKSQFEIDYSPSQIDAIVFEWEEAYSTPAPLKAFQPRMKSLVFHEGEGLRYNCELKKNFIYLLTFDISYDAQAKKLQDRNDDLVAVKKFISSIEGDLHGRTIMENNKSGQPALISFEQKDSIRTIRLHHPMHDITYDRGAKTYSYLYTDEVASVAKLPEMKRVLTDTDVRKFVAESTESVQVRVEGNPKAGFMMVFTRLGSGAQIRVRFDGKKVVPVSS